VRKPSQEKLKPTPAQERERERTGWRGRLLSNTARAQRSRLWKQRGVSLTRSQQEAELTDLRQEAELTDLRQEAELTDLRQEAELTDLRAERPEDGALPSQVLQDVLARLDTTSQACCRRVANGEPPGVARFHGKNRSHWVPFKEYGTGARLANGSLVLSTSGRRAVRWSRPIQGTLKTGTIGKEAEGWYVCCCGADGSVEPVPLTGRATGRDGGRTALLTPADGDSVKTPRH
jgi:transposase